MAKQAMRADGKRVRFSWRLLLPLLACIGSLPSAAAPTVQMDEAQRLLEEQRARQRDEQMEQPRPAIKREEQPVSEFDLRGDPASLPEVEPAFDIVRIDLKGDALLDAEQQETILGPFRGLRLGQNRINLLLRRLTAALIDKGLITSRAYIGPQNLASGTLEVTLVAGRIEAIQLNGQPAGGPALAPLPFRTEEVLRLADLEQGVDQINRLPSSRAEMQILPGQSPGGSVVDLRTQVQNPWRFHLGADNYGQESTGTTRGRAMIEADNLLGLFDSWNLTHIQSGDSQASLFSVAVPWGYNTLSYIYTTSDYTNPISGIANITGDSTNHSLDWNRVIQRDANAKTALDAMLTLRRFQRNVAGVALQPQDMSVLRLGLSRLQRWQRADLSVDLGYVRGLDSLGAGTDVPGLPKAAPHYQFDKADTSLIGTVALGADVAYRGSVAGQYSNRGLQSSEQIFIGGASTVRGFQEGALSGDRGGYTRQELHWTGAGSHLHVVPYLFYDYGRVRLLADPGWNQLAAWGVGANASWKGFSTALAWGQPTSAPWWIDRGSRLHASLNYQF